MFHICIVDCGIDISAAINKNINQRNEIHYGLLKTDHVQLGIYLSGSDPFCLIKQLFKGNNSRFKMSNKRIKKEIDKLTIVR